MTVTVRFAPSPTGRLHVGNVRTALFNYLFAKGQGGDFVLRLDDTDTERSTQAFADGIAEDLAWLGLVHDRTFRQSDRFARYDAVAEDLKARGLLYPCYETPEELERKRKLQRTRGLPPVYDRAALSLTDEDRAALEAEGRKPHWRFKLDGRRTVWEDMVRGQTEIDTSSISDPILVREDGTYLYTLPSVVDDVDEKITHIIRGEDHVTNSGAQIQIFEAVGGTAPIFGHTSLLVGAQGEALSKRLGSLTVQSLRQEGLEPMAVVSLLARLGTSQPVEPQIEIGALAGAFSMETLGRAPARFDADDLRGLNAKLLHEMPYDRVAERLKALGVGGGAAFWETARANLTVLADAVDLWRIVNGPVTPVIGEADAAVIKASIDCLPEGPFDDTTWSVLTAAVKEKTGAKGKALFKPLRLALTGAERGPEMDKLLALIGPERAKARLNGETA
ncbi:MAG: glutamate--tRNA ligase [Alphaproteobacteria bacterium]